MKKLWAPWRMEFIGSGPRGCVFCTLPQNSDDRESLILRRGRHTFVIMNRFPYNNGHIMVAPHRHVKALDSLSEEELTDLMKLLNRTKIALDKKLKPHGYNIGANYGKTGGAGFAGHVHIHIVPRWNGDSNFMPIVGNTKVVSESLDAVFTTLKK